MMLPTNILGDAAAAATMVQRASKNERKSERVEPFLAVYRQTTAEEIKPITDISKEYGVDKSGNRRDQDQTTNEYKYEIRNFHPPLIYNNSDQLVKLNTPYPMPERLGKLFDREA